MTELLIIVALGLLILIFGLRLLRLSDRQRQTPPVTMEEFANARRALDGVFAEAAAIDRIFSTEDMDFISQASVPNVRRRFLGSRKALATQWLRQLQAQVAQLMELHLRLAALARQSSYWLELQLSASYACFWLTSHLLLILMRMFGPFRVRRMVAYISRLAGKFCTIFSLRLESVDSARIEGGEFP